MLRYAIDLWAVSSTKDKLDSYLRLLPKDIISPYTRPDTSFKIKVEIFGNSQTQREKVEKIEVNVISKIKLKLTIIYILYY